MVRTTVKMVLACGVLLMAACAPDTKPTDAKLAKALNAYYENRNECLFPAGLKFPYEVSPGTDAKTEKTRMDAMTGAGLLKRQDAPALKVERYTLTPLGERVAGRFCYGHRVITSVDGFTEPTKKDGFIETTATYRYSMMDVPVWAKTDEMRAAFPAMAATIAATQPAQMTLATAGAGWQVPQ